MNSHFLWGWRSLWRDLRAGELRLVIVAIALATAALTAVGFFADRIQQALQRDAGQLLGGDAVLASDNAPDAHWRDTAVRAGLQVATSVSFPTMARATTERGGAARLVSLKAVESGYPLRGTLLLGPDVASARPARQATSEGIPPPGQVWVDAALLSALDLREGDTLLLGQAALRIGQTIAIEPDRGAGFLNFAPRVLLNTHDLASTALIQPASRLNYRMAVAGSTPRVKAFADWAAGHIKEQGLRGVRLESLEGGRPEMSQTIDRAHKFLTLVSLLAALLCAVAVALAARRFASTHLDDCAMLRVLGLGQRAIAWGYALEFTLVGLLGAVLGVGLGWAVHFGLVALMAGLVQADLPPPGWMPVGLGLGMALTLLLAFGLPPVLQLARVPALRVIRRDMGQLRAASLGVLGVGLLGFAALLLVVSRDPVLGGIAVGGFAGAVALFAAAAWGAVGLLRRVVGASPQAPRWLVLATRQLAAQRAFAVVQVGALAVGLLALVLLVLLRTDLIDSWRRATPPDAPDRFVINIQPEQTEAFRAALERAQVRDYDWYPMVRGRLVSVNDRAVGPEDYQDDRAKRLVDREFNLSYSPQAPQHNRIVSGRWQSGEADGISMEEGIMQTLRLKLGDTVVFDMGGIQRSVRITSVRKVDWGGMRANFFALFPLERLDDVPVTYLAAYRGGEQTAFDNALVREFPNITQVDMRITIAQIQRVLGQVVRAVEALFGFSLAAGLVVLLAAVGATREQRQREYAIMRAVGAPNVLLARVQRAELLGVGALAGALASLAALAVGWALARYVFEFEWTLQWWLPVGGASAGAVLAWAAGWWGLRDVLRHPVVDTLRRATI